MNLFIVFLLCLIAASCSCGCLGERSLEQELFYEEYRCVQSVISIFLLNKAMPFVLCQDVPDRNSILRRGNKFCGVFYRDTGIILSLNDK